MCALFRVPQPALHSTYISGMHLTMHEHINSFSAPWNADFLLRNSVFTNCHTVFVQIAVGQSESGCVTGSQSSVYTSTQWTVTTLLLHQEMGEHVCPLPSFLLSSLSYNSPFIFHSLFLHLFSLLSYFFPSFSFISLWC